jgi:hypothetical protein
MISMAFIFSIYTLFSFEFRIYYCGQGTYDQGPVFCSLRNFCTIDSFKIIFKNHKDITYYLVAIMVKLIGFELFCVRTTNADRQTVQTWEQREAMFRKLGELKEENQNGDISAASHSNRIGAATDADQNPNIQTSWIVQRGDGLMDRISKAFE